MLCKQYEWSQFASTTQTVTAMVALMQTFVVLWYLDGIHCIFSITADNDMVLLLKIAECAQPSAPSRLYQVKRLH